ncbi:unnamed protein product [Merluccius merluccius]
MNVMERARRCASGPGERSDTEEGLCCEATGPRQGMPSGQNLPARPAPNATEGERLSVPHTTSRTIKPQESYCGFHSAGGEKVVRRAPFSSKPSTDCFSPGSGLLDNREDKAGTVEPSGGVENLVVVVVVVVVGGAVVVVVVVVVVGGGNGSIYVCE